MRAQTSAARPTEAATASASSPSALAPTRPALSTSQSRIAKETDRPAAAHAARPAAGRRHRRRPARQKGRVMASLRSLLLGPASAVALAFGVAGVGEVPAWAQTEEAAEPEIAPAEGGHPPAHGDAHGAGHGAHHAAEPPPRSTGSLALRQDLHGGKLTRRGAMRRAAVRPHQLAISSRCGEVRRPKLATYLRVRHDGQGALDEAAQLRARRAPSWTSTTAASRAWTRRSPA